MKIWKQHLARNDIIIMVNQAVWLIKLIELLFLFCSKWVWLTKQLGLPGYAVTRNSQNSDLKETKQIIQLSVERCKKFSHTKRVWVWLRMHSFGRFFLKKPRLLYNYHLKGVRSFLTQKESIRLMQSHQLPMKCRQILLPLQVHSPSSVDLSNQGSGPTP